MRALAKIGLIVWTILMALWFVSGMIAVSNNDDCLTEACEAGRNVGAGIGIAFIMFIAMIGYVILGVIWMVSKPSTRPCPACGADVANGLVACAHCGHDFRAGSAGGRWEKDPIGRHELRYWDGAEWTASVSDAGVSGHDPL